MSVVDRPSVQGGPVAEAASDAPGGCGGVGRRMRPARAHLPSGGWRCLLLVGGRSGGRLGGRSGRAVGWPAGRRKRLCLGHVLGANSTEDPKEVDEGGQSPQGGSPEHLSGRACADRGRRINQPDGQQSNHTEPKCQHQHQTLKPTIVGPNSAERAPNWAKLGPPFAVIAPPPQSPQSFQFWSNRCQTSQHRPRLVNFSSRLGETSRIPPTPAQ